MRNPWRFSFDPVTFDLWIADVGQNAWEEVTYLPAGSAAGANLGWNRLEGNAPFRGAAPTDAVAPVFVASHAAGNCAVTGGEVYRGTAIPALVGTYIFADHCQGELTGIRVGGASAVETHVFAGVTAPSVTAFGRSPDGELYVLSLTGTIHRIDGA